MLFGKALYSSGAVFCCCLLLLIFSVVILSWFVCYLFGCCLNVWKSTLLSSSSSTISRFSFFYCLFFCFFATHLRRKSTLLSNRSSTISRFSLSIAISNADLASKQYKQIIRSFVQKVKCREDEKQDKMWPSDELDVDQSA